MRSCAIGLIVAVLSTNWWAATGSVAELQPATDVEVVEIPVIDESEAPVFWEPEVAADQSPNPIIRLDTEFFRPMLNFQNRQSDKELIILQNNAEWPCFPTVVVGGQARLSVLGAATNTKDKFSYLGRFPPDFKGHSATDARMLQANAALAAHVNSWVNVYGELLFSDVFSFPTAQQGSLQVRQAYAVLGDLTRTPWYAFLGKKNVSFGDMGTLAPFSQSVVWHYFGALHEGVGLGYDQNGFNLSVTGINGGRGIRVADSKARGQMNNFAVNASWQGGDETWGWNIGGGYLHGTIYDVTEAEHVDPNAFGPYNSAWDAYAELNFGAWTLAGEFVSTVDDWPVTDHPVIAYRAEAAYDTCLWNRPTRYAVSWSEGIQGPSGSEFEFNKQLVVGVGMDFGPHVMASAEYVRSIGFAPLIDINTVSDRDVAQDSLVLGLTVVF